MQKIKSAIRRPKDILYTRYQVYRSTRCLEGKAVIASFNTRDKKKGG